MNLKLKLLASTALIALALFALPARAQSALADPITINITSVDATTGASLQIVDVGYYAANNLTQAEKLAVEVTILTNATAPGADRTVTVYYAFANAGAYTAAQMATAASNQILAVANATTTTRVYTLPVVYISGRYLYLWLDHTARDASSTLTLTVKVLGVGR